MGAPGQAAGAATLSGESAPLGLPCSPLRKRLHGNAARRPARTALSHRRYLADIPVEYLENTYTHPGENQIGPQFQAPPGFSGFELRQYTLASGNIYLSMHSFTCT